MEHHKQEDFFPLLGGVKTEFDGYKNYKEYFTKVSYLLNNIVEPIMEQIRQKY